MFVDIEGVSYALKFRRKGEMREVTWCEIRHGKEGFLLARGVAVCRTPVRFNQVWGDKLALARAVVVLTEDKHLRRAFLAAYDDFWVTYKNRKRMHS